jgi:hypothetical protein
MTSNGSPRTTRGRPQRVHLAGDDQKLTAGGDVPDHRSHPHHWHQSLHPVNFKGPSQDSNRPDPRVICRKNVDAVSKHPDPLERIQTVRYWLDNYAVEIL